MRRAILAGLLLAASAGPARAGRLTGVSYDPASVPVGAEQHFWATYDNQPGYLPVVWTWTKVVTRNGQPAELAVDGGQGPDNVGIRWGFPGGRLVKLEVVYDVDPATGRWPPADTFTTGAVTVFPPDTETPQPFGYDTPVLSGEMTVITTVWTYRGQQVVMDASTTAQEKLLYLSPQTGAPLGFKDYGQAATQNTDTWFFMIDSLADTKDQGGDVSIFPVPFPYLDLWQKSRLVYFDEDGTWKYAEGPARYWRRWRVADPYGFGGLFWQLSLVQGATPPAGF